MTQPTEPVLRPGEIVLIHLPDDPLDNTKGIIQVRYTPRTYYVFVLGRIWTICIAALESTGQFTKIPDETY